MASGNLEMYGVTKNVKFPAKMSVADGKATARAQFNINRKDWGMSYGADESLGDKFIRPTVHIGFEIAASK
jgi:polyisoprenoid-binding protein YceI